MMERFPILRFMILLNHRIGNKNHKIHYLLNFYFSFPVYSVTKLTN